MADEESLRQRVEELEREVVRLREQEVVLQSLLDLTTASVFAKDLDGRYIFANPNAAALAGRSVDEIVGRTDAELYPAEQAERFREHDLDVLRRNEPVTTTMPVPAADGVRTFLSIMVPLVDATGATFGVAGIASDISERVRAEELLRRRTADLVEAQHIARIGSWAWDPAAQQIEISAELNLLLGFEPDRRWTVEALVALIHDDDRVATVKALLAAADGFAIDHVYRIHRPDGAQMWLQIRSAGATDDDGTSPGRVVGTIQDVTSRELAEQQRLELELRLQRTQRLESIGLLAGGIAHDFNNLLAVIGIQAELARQELAPGHPADEHLARHQLAVDRAAALARQLLVFSRRERHDQRTLDLDELVDDVASLLRRTLGDDVNLLVELAEEPSLIVGDRSQIEQVLMNLAVNARDAMPEGGALTITTAHVPSGAPGGGPGGGPSGGPGGGPAMVRLSVADTGRGMEPAVLNRAFEPFFTTKPTGEATGLGLATVHEIVHRAGGEVRITSEPGRGTRVDVLLPASDTSPAGHAASRAAPPGTAPVGSGERILVVEDNEPLAALVQHVLERAGYEPLVALGGADALRLAEHGSVDLLLTDVVMAGVSGREVAERLRRDCPDLAVVFMSGYTDGMIDADGNETVLLSKPFTPEQLLDVVAVALTSRRAG